MKANMLKIRGLLITLSHLATISISLTVAFWIRFEFSLRTPECALLIGSLILVLPIKMVVFLFGGLHKGSWRYAGLADVFRIYVVNIAASGISAVTLFASFGSEFPRSVYVIDFLICFLLTGGARFCVRLCHETFRSERPAPGTRILIYGAGTPAELSCGKSV